MSPGIWALPTEAILRISGTCRALRLLRLTSPGSLGRTSRWILDLGYLSLMTHNSLSSNTTASGSSMAATRPCDQWLDEVVAIFSCGDSVVRRYLNLSWRSSKVSPTFRSLENPLLASLSWTTLWFWPMWVSFKPPRTTSNLMCFLESLRSLIPVSFDLPNTMHLPSTETCLQPFDKLFNENMSDVISLICISCKAF